ncbi:hypothetical protein [Aliamphritea spongicola]|nr:hypothetical protein [Aliamphritea spongicola]
MNCEVCGLKIRINWGSGHVALCEEHSDCAADLEQAKLTHAAHFAEDDGAPALASRWTRLCAACIDALITMAVTLPFMFYLDYWTVIAEQQAVPLELSIKVAIFSWAMFFLVHGYLLKKKARQSVKILWILRLLPLMAISLSFSFNHPALFSRCFGELHSFGWPVLIID